MLSPEMAKSSKAFPNSKTLPRGTPMILSGITNSAGP